MSSVLSTSRCPISHKIPTPNQCLCISGSSWTSIQWDPDAPSGFPTQLVGRWKKVGLAKGVSIKGPGGSKIVFCVVSHLLGDIPALREGLNLNVPASCNYPCIFCHVRNYRSPPALGRCSYACGTSPEFLRKTSQEYEMAYQNPGRANLSMALSCKSTAGPGSEAPRLLHGLPGVSIPESVAVDLLHTEFLGESLRHLKFYLKKLVVSTGLRDAVLCKKNRQGISQNLESQQDHSPVGVQGHQVLKK